MGNWIEQWFSNFRSHQNHWDRLLQPRFLVPNPRVSESVRLGGAQEFSFLSSSQVMLLLLPPGSGVVGCGHHSWQLLCLVTFLHMKEETCLERKGTWEGCSFSAGAVAVPSWRPVGDRCLECAWRSRQSMIQWPAASASPAAFVSSSSRAPFQNSWARILWGPRICDFRVLVDCFTCSSLRTTGPTQWGWLEKMSHG